MDKLDPRLAFIVYVELCTGIKFWDCPESLLDYLAIRYDRGMHWMYYVPPKNFKYLEVGKK